MAIIKHEVAVQASVFVAFVSMIAQVSLLARTDVTTVAAVFNRVRRLAAWRVVGTLARVHALAARRRRLHAHTHTHILTAHKYRLHLLRLISHA